MNYVLSHSCIYVDEFTSTENSEATSRHIAQYLLNQHA